MPILDEILNSASRPDDVILSDKEFRVFRDYIYQECGISLSDAKKMMLRSRLQRRLHHHRLSTFTEYYELIKSKDPDGSERREMINCVTTNKTDFFREPHHFEFIRNTILPDITSGNDHDSTPNKLRVWHAGCSTGEEPYTLAITLNEALGRTIDRWDIRLLATDIDTKVLDHASHGIYDQEKFDQVPANLQRKYFLRGTGIRSNHYKVKTELQDLITFKQINLLDPNWPIAASVRFDIIFCRNVVIYFDKPTQRTLFQRYHSLLRPGGYLFIGHSESLLGVTDEFESLGHTIYRVS